jgi:hypothetical protein
LEEFRVEIMMDNDDRNLHEVRIVEVEERRDVIQGIIEYITVVRK